MYSSEDGMLVMEGCEIMVASHELAQLIERMLTCHKAVREEGLTPVILEAQSPKKGFHFSVYLDHGAVQSDEKCEAEIEALGDIAMMFGFSTLEEPEAETYKGEPRCSWKFG